MQSALHYSQIPSPPSKTHSLLLCELCNPPKSIPQPDIIFPDITLFMDEQTGVDNNIWAATTSKPTHIMFLHINIRRFQRTQKC